MNRCEAVQPPSDGRLGKHYRQCPAPAAGVRPMRSALHGGYHLADGHLPHYACESHLVAAGPVYAFEKEHAEGA